MINLFFIIIGIFAAGAIASLIFQKGKNAALISHGFSILGSALALVFSSNLILNKISLSQMLPTSFPFFNIAIHIDFLSAFFIFIISLIALPASVYGIGYMKHYAQEYNLGIFGFFYNLFILSLLLVVTSYNGLYFIFTWELMSLTLLFLVIFENKKHEVIESGFIYFVMTHAATAFLMVAFLLLYLTTGSFDFDIIKAHSASIPFIIQTIIFVSMIVGFGTKAGIIPLHIWLPRAHSAAPSHVSAIMSGVVIKMGIFMFFRMFVDILTPAPLWLGIAIILIGAISSILGVLYALSEHDIKRLLAYHSIENIGIILLGLGSGLIFLSLNMPQFATLAITAGLFHTVNHAIFKSLLFLGAGSVISKTHTRNMEEFGGLIKLMPYTALFFLIGAIAISGLPPFNGFASEWLTFQSLFAGIATKGIAIKSIFIFSAGCLAFTGGLAAACFVKAFGTTFLARPRSEEAKKAKESSSLLLISMGFLAALCLAFGVFSSTIVNRLQIVTNSLGAFGKNISALETSGSSLIITPSFASLNMPILATFIIAGILLAGLLVFALSYKQKTVRDILWDCGFTNLSPRMEITATGFSRSLIIIFKGIFQPTKQHEVEYVDANMRYFSRSIKITLGILNFYEDYIYYPLHSKAHSVSLQIKKIQSGNINQYLLYILVLLVGLLIFARL